jgi:hypothetical protein
LRLKIYALTTKHCYKYGIIFLNKVAVIPGKSHRKDLIADHITIEQLQKTGGESKCVAMMTISTHTHTLTMAKSTSMSTSTMENISMDISAAINAEIISQKFLFRRE